MHQHSDDLGTTSLMLKDSEYNTTSEFRILGVFFVPLYSLYIYKPTSSMKVRMKKGEN